jgi:hypothetical protein
MFEPEAQVSRRARQRARMWPNGNKQHAHKHAHARTDVRQQVFIQNGKMRRCAEASSSANRARATSQRDVPESNGQSFTDSESGSDAEDMSDSELAQSFGAAHPRATSPKPQELPPGWELAPQNGPVWMYAQSACGNLVAEYALGPRYLHKKSGYICRNVESERKIAQLTLREIGDGTHHKHQTHVPPNWTRCFNKRGQQYFRHKRTGKTVSQVPSERDSPAASPPPEPAWHPQVESVTRPVAPLRRAPPPPDLQAEAIFAAQLQQALRLSLDVAAKADAAAKVDALVAMREAEDVERAIQASKNNSKNDRRRASRVGGAREAQAKAERSWGGLRRASPAPAPAPAPESDECVICLSEAATHVVVPCGHQALCANCAPEQLDKCPVCRGPSTQVIRVFRP